QARRLPYQRSWRWPLRGFQFPELLGEPVAFFRLRFKRFGRSGTAGFGLLPVADSVFYDDVQGFGRGPLHLPRGGSSRPVVGLPVDVPDAGRKSLVAFRRNRLGGYAHVSKPGVDVNQSLVAILVPPPVGNDFDADVGIQRLAGA